MLRVQGVVGCRSAEGMGLYVGGFKSLGVIGGIRWFHSIDWLPNLCLLHCVLGRIATV